MLDPNPQHELTKKTPEKIRQQKTQPNLTNTSPAVAANTIVAAQNPAQAAILSQKARGVDVHKKQASPKSAPILENPRPQMAHNEPATTPQPRRKHPPLTFDSTETDQLALDYPNWYQVIDKYPQMAKLYGHDSDDLCARCFIGKDGYLEDCEVAGQATADATVRAGAKLMMSMIHISFKDGRSAEGKQVGIPVRFGRFGSEPANGYCRNKDSEFLP